MSASGTEILLNFDTLAVAGKILISTSKALCLEQDETLQNCTETVAAKMQRRDCYQLFFREQFIFTMKKSQNKIKTETT